jgi:hypothetical protein
MSRKPLTVKHAIRSKDGGTVVVTLTPMKAIRAKCMECSDWQQNEARLCAARSCPLHPYRMGYVPETDPLEVV